MNIPVLYIYTHTHTHIEASGHSQQTQMEEFFHSFMHQPVLCSAFWNCMCPRHRAACSTIYLTFPFPSPLFRPSLLLTCLEILNSGMDSSRENT